MKKLRLKPKSNGGVRVQRVVRRPVELEIIDELYRRKARREVTHAFVTTTQPLPMSRWNGRHPPEKNTTHDTIPSGATLKIVMVSRMGDCGLTDHLDAVNGYGLRLDWESPAMTDIRWHRTPND